MATAKIPTGSIWKSDKTGRTLFYAEIQYLGRRYKHSGSPNRETVETWLKRKREKICEMEESRKSLLTEILKDSSQDRVERSPIREVREIKGSIVTWTTTRNGKQRTRYQAELQILGMKVRKCSDCREKCEEWLEEKTSAINAILDSNNKAIEANHQEYLQKDSFLRGERKKQVRSFMENLGLKITSNISKMDKYNIENHNSWFTYILQDGSSTMFKIGKTRNLKKRLSQFSNPAFHYRFIHCGDIEKKCHLLMEKYRVHGEWFCLTEEDIMLLRNRFVFISFDD